MRTLYALLVFVPACSTERQAPPSSNVVRWTATAAGERTESNGDAIVDVLLAAQVDQGWKVYSLGQKGGGPVAMSVKVDSTAPYRIDGEIVGPPAVRDQDPNFGIETETYTGEPVFRFAVRVPPSADRTAPLRVKVRSQACSDRLCLPARTTTVTVEKKPPAS